MDYQGNSKKNKELPPGEEATELPEKKVEKVITGEVVLRKKPIGRKIKEIFFGGEFKGAAEYVAADVLLPAFRNLMVDAATRGIERVVYGESSRPIRPRHPEYRPRVTYNNPIQRGYNDSPLFNRANLPDQPSRGRMRRNGMEVVLTSREEAELVLERLTDIIDKYEVASLADLNELIGQPISHVDQKWGWVVLTGVEIRQIREGYLLDLPSAEAL